MVSGCTMSLIPLDKFVTNGFSVVAGMGSCSVICFAHGGSLTFAFFVETSDSPPPKLFEEIGLSDGVGVRIAEMAWSKSRYFLGDAIHIINADGAKQIDVVVRRIASFNGHGG